MPARTTRRFARLILVVALAAWAVPRPCLSQTTLRGGATYNAPPPTAAPLGGDVFSSNGGSRGNTTYRTGTQTFQPTDAPCASPYGCGRGGPYQGGTGSDVYCQDSPGMPQRGPYSHTGTNTPCGLGGSGSAPGYAAPVQQQQGPKQPKFYFFYINGINTPYQGIVRQPPGSRSNDPGGTYAYESGRVKAMLIDSPITGIPGTTSMFGGESYNFSGTNPLFPRSAASGDCPTGLADWISCRVDRARAGTGFAMGDVWECYRQATRANIQSTAHQDEVSKIVRMIEQYFARDTGPGSTTEPYFIVVAHSQGNFFAEGVGYRLFNPDPGDQEAAGPFIAAHRLGIVSLGSPTRYDSLPPGFVADRLKHLTRDDDAILVLEPLTAVLSGALRSARDSIPWLPKATGPTLAQSTKRPFSGNAASLWTWKKGVLASFLSNGAPGIRKLFDWMGHGLPPLVTPFMNAHLLDNYLSGPPQTPLGVTATPTVLAPADRTIPQDLSDLLMIDATGRTEEQVSAPPGTSVTAIVQAQVRDLKRTLLADPASTQSAPVQAQGAQAQGADLGRAASSMVLKLFGQ